VSGTDIPEVAEGSKGTYFQVVREKEGKLVKLSTSKIVHNINSPSFDEVAVTAARLLTDKTWNTKLTLRFFQTNSPQDVLVGETSFDLETARKAGVVDVVLKKHTGQIAGSLKVKLEFRKAMDTDHEEEEVDVGTVRSAKIIQQAPTVAALPKAQPPLPQDLKASIQSKEDAAKEGLARSVSQENVTEAPLSLVISVPQDNIKKPLRFTTIMTGEEVLQRIKEQTNATFDVSACVLVHESSNQIINAGRKIGAYDFLQTGDNVAVKPKPARKPSVKK